MPRMFGDNNPARRPEVRLNISLSKMGRKNPMWKPKISKNCAICGRIFHDLSSSIVKCCSKECSTKLRVRQIERRLRYGSTLCSNPEEAGVNKSNATMKWWSENRNELLPKFKKRMEGTRERGIATTRLRYGKSMVKNPEERRANVSMAVRKLWSNPKFAESQMRKLSKPQKRISKPQHLLYEIIKSMCPDAVEELFIKLNDMATSLDIAIPSMKINIEFDGAYWHQDRKEHDAKRDAQLMAKGWKIIRVGHDELGRVQSVKPSNVNSFLILMQYLNLKDRDYAKCRSLPSNTRV